MDEEKFKEFVDGVKGSIDVILTKLEALEEKEATLEKVIFEDIYEPAMEQIKVDEFSKKYGEKLSPYSDDLKAIMGDDTDINREAVREWDKIADEDKPDQDEWVDSFAENIKSQIDDLKQKLGASSVEVKSDEEGETKVVVDGEEVETEGEESEEVKTDSTDEDDEIKKFEDELRKQL